MCVRVGLGEAGDCAPWDGRSLRVPVPASGRGLDTSHISDRETGLSASQPWPAEVGGCGFGGD